MSSSLFQVFKAKLGYLYLDCVGLTVSKEPTSVKCMYFIREFCET
jgi:hypothetical protein